MPTDKQYTLPQILGIWAVVSVPMALLAWVITPALIPLVKISPGIIFWLMMILGMFWQFLVAFFIVHHELGTLSWPALRNRTWLNLPRDPKSNTPRGRLFWWLLPIGILCILFQMSGIGGYLDSPVVKLFPSLAAPAYTDIRGLASPEFTGQWWLVAVALVSAVLNYFLGEEFLFRGILLPKMQGVFGKWDWVANSILFGCYHLHKPWMIPSIAVYSLLIIWPARYFRSNWMAIILHGVEGIFMLVIVVGTVLGLM